MHKKNIRLIRIIAVAILLLSVALRFVVDNEALKTGLAAVTNLMLGIDRTIAYIETKEKIELYFSIMFYVFCILAIVFAIVEVFFHPV